MVASILFFMSTPVLEKAQEEACYNFCGTIDESLFRDPRNHTALVLASSSGIHL
jgi:hypothetical protein